MQGPEVPSRQAHPSRHPGFLGIYLQGARIWKIWKNQIILSECYIFWNELPSFGMFWTVYNTIWSSMAGGSVWSKFCCWKWGPRGGPGPHSIEWKQNCEESSWSWSARLDEPLRQKLKRGRTLVELQIFSTLNFLCCILLVPHTYIKYTYQCVRVFFRSFACRFLWQLAGAWIFFPVTESPESLNHWLSRCQLTNSCSIIATPSP